MTNKNLTLWKLNILIQFIIFNLTMLVSHELVKPIEVPQYFFGLFLWSIFQFFLFKLTKDFN